MVIIDRLPLTPMLKPDRAALRDSIVLRGGDIQIQERTG
jgi:hypothetical protein